MQTPKIHEMPQPTHQAISGQRRQTANREAQNQPHIPHVTPRTDPLKQHYIPRDTHVAHVPQLTPAWGQNPCSNDGLNEVEASIPPRQD